MHHPFGAVASLVPESHHPHHPQHSAELELVSLFVEILRPHAGIAVKANGSPLRVRAHVDAIYRDSFVTA